MSDLRKAVEESGAAKYQVLTAHQDILFNPANALEPDQLQFARTITDRRYKAPASLITNKFDTCDRSGDLYEIGIRPYIDNPVDGCSVNMPEGKVFEQVFKGENPEFFL